MILIHHEQQSPEWLAWREGGIGASESAAVLGLNPWQSHDKLLRVKAGLDAPFTGNYHTRRGHEREPVARRLYEDLMGWEASPACGQHEQHPWLRASFDGYRPGHLVAEIKAPTPKWHTVQGDDPPPWYVVQVQHQLLVAGLDLAHYVSYCPEWPSPPRRLTIIPIRADKEFQTLLLAALATFWAEVGYARARAVRPRS